MCSLGCMLNYNKIWLNIVCTYHGLLVQPGLAGKSIKEL